MFGFKLNETLGSSYPANENDVLNMKSALQDLGEYDSSKYDMTPYPDTPLFEGIKRVQKKNGLYVDGTARPGGPTEITVNAALAQKEVDAQRKSKGKQTAGGQHSQSRSGWWTASDNTTLIGPKMCSL